LENLDNLSKRSVYFDSSLASQTKIVVHVHCVQNFRLNGDFAVYRLEGKIRLLLLLLLPKLRLQRGIVGCIFVYKEEAWQQKMAELFD